MSFPFPHRFFFKVAVGKTSILGRYVSAFGPYGLAEGDRYLDTVFKKMFFK
jgi:hypothetical protein